MKNNELVSLNNTITFLERAAKYSETLMDDIPGVYVILNEHNHVIRANKAFSELIEYDIEACLNYDFIALFDRENGQKMLSATARIRADDAQEKEVKFKTNLVVNGQEKHSSLEALRNFIQVVHWPAHSSCSLVVLPRRSLH